MSALQKLFKQTFIYGLATVLPRMLSFLLTPFYTSNGVLSSPAEYGELSIIFSYFIILNVILSYGMETAFFRFFNKEGNKQKVISTSTISILISSIGFFFIAILLKHEIASLIRVKEMYVNLVIWVILLDALAIIPFAWLRATQKPIKYSVIKILNVIVNIGLNFFLLLWLKNLAVGNNFFNSIYKPNYEINYIIIALIIASSITLLLMLPFYVKVKYNFDKKLWKSMMRYALPVLIAGIAYTINETFDKILLDYLLPKNISKTQIGMYSACYKIAVFMTLFVTAYRLGIEPFFFSHAKSKNPQKNYALILEFFVALGSIILLSVVVFADIFKVFIVRSEAYWEAMWVVPIILLANFCLGIYHNLSVWYKITDKTKFGAYISIIGAIITLVLNFWLIPIMSYKGSAIATLAAYASMMFISFYLGRKYYPIPYNFKKIGLYLIISILFSTISFYLFRGNYLIGSSFLLVFLGFVFFIEKKELKKLFIKK